MMTNSCLAWALRHPPSTCWEESSGAWSTTSSATGSVTLIKMFRLNNLGFVHRSGNNFWELRSFFSLFSSAPILSFFQSGCLARAPTPAPTETRYRTFFWLGHASSTSYKYNTYRPEIHPVCRLPTLAKPVARSALPVGGNVVFMHVGETFLVLRGCLARAER